MQLYAPIDMCRVIRDDRITHEWVINPRKPLIEVGPSNIITYDVRLGRVIREVPINFTKENELLNEFFPPSNYDEMPYFESPESINGSKIGSEHINDILQHIPDENDSNQFSDFNDHLSGLDLENDQFDAIGVYNEALNNSSDESGSTQNYENLDEDVPIISEIYNSIICGNFR
ncbi:hypothetical protein AYI68_g7447 [Smittium mucronatum]|uniref:Uncharacterized protein n=1 Tax=Smittium mucronatum TaxID=133383 RepID=A0A1R0GNN1_9FUNG|nr:hypothetical protein AYI68_g7447 [Smittium mucronatum]